jgi:hypothetical protein
MFEEKAVFVHVKLDAGEQCRDSKQAPSTLSHSPARRARIHGMFPGMFRSSPCQQQPWPLVTDELAFALAAVPQ